MQNNSHLSGSLSIFLNIYLGSSTEPDNVPFYKQIPFTWWLKLHAIFIIGKLMLPFIDSVYRVPFKADLTMYDLMRDLINKPHYLRACSKAYLW